MQHPTSEATDERGFTLIEVVVSLFLIGIVAAGALVFFVRGMQNTSHVQRTQAATVIATQGMELVRAVDPRATTGTSGLLTGRSKADVQAAWGAADAADIAQTNMAWDLLTPSADPTKQSVRLVRSTTVSDMRYTTTTLIGTCYRSGAASTAKQPCTAAKPAAAVLMYRATVVVKWKAGKDGQCAAGGCSYRLTALIDPTVDASWNLSAKPVAYDDDATYSAGGPKTFFDILANDAITFVNANPTTIISNPSHGTVEVIGSGDSKKMGAVYYTPPANYSGPVSFTYKLRDAQGRNSNEAVVSIAVLPTAIADSMTVARGATVSIPVSSNDMGSLSSVIIKSQPSRGTVTASGPNINFTSSGSTALGTVTFTYAAIDATGQESLPATVTVVIAEKPPTSSDIVIPDIMSSTNDSETVLDIQGLTGNASSLNVVIVSGPTAMDGTPASTVGELDGSGTSTITYEPKEGTVGAYTFTFQLQNGSGPLSPVHTALIRVVPSANPFKDNKVTVSGGASKTIEVRGGNSPSKIDPTGAVTYATDGIVTCTQGGTVSQEASVTMPAADNGAFAFVAPRWSGGNNKATCSFLYTMTWTQGPHTYTTPAALVTVNVKR